MDLGMKDRVAIVTGGSRGVGRAIARKLAREGARVALTYKSDRSQADAVASELGDAIVAPFDLAAPESIGAVVKGALDRWGKIDILVHAAEQRVGSDWPSFLHANIDGAYAAIQAVVPAMRARGWGRIVALSSGIGADGPHAAVSSALHGLARTLAKELGPAGILINVVAAGLTLTERNVEMIPSAVREQAAQASPIRRLVTADEIAPTIAFLASGANTAVTGELVRTH